MTPYQIISDALTNPTQKALFQGTWGGDEFEISDYPSFLAIEQTINQLINAGDINVRDVETYIVSLSSFIVQSSIHY